MPGNESTPQRFHDDRPRVDGEILKRIRRRLGLSQKTLAMFVEVHRDSDVHYLDGAYISRLESGNRVYADPDYALALQDAVKKLCEEEGKDFKPFVFVNRVDIPSVRVDHSSRSKRSSNGRTSRAASDIYKFAQAYRAFRSDPTVQRVQEMLEESTSGVAEDKGDIRTLGRDSIVHALDMDHRKLAEWEVQMRRALDVFLEELLFFDSYLRAGAIAVDELQYLGGVVGLLCGKGKTHDDHELLAHIWKYVDGHGFSKVRTLAMRLGYAPPEPEIEIP